MHVDISSAHQAFTLTGVVIGDQKLAAINQLSVRAAMALPEYFIHSSLDNLSFEIEQCRLLNKRDIIAIIENPQINYKRRFAAGQMLALLGDPRIDVNAPEMLDVPAAQVRIGLAVDRIEQVVEQYAHYGVLPEWIKKETPQYTAQINSFGLAKYCVTQQEYRAFLLETSYARLPDSWRFGVYPREQANHPVQSINPEDAQAYITWLNGKTGRRFRLPTEAEWEYAAGGTQGLEFPWGDLYLPDHCNTLESGILQTTPVGCFPLGAGPFGHLDLAGNVEEYVADDYHAYPGGREIVDDLLLNQGSYRIARGGSFSRFRDLARTRRRHGRFNSTLYIMGFRLAETL